MRIDTVSVVVYTTGRHRPIHYIINYSNTMKKAVNKIPEAQGDSIFSLDDAIFTDHGIYKPHFPKLKAEADKAERLGKSSTK